MRSPTWAAPDGSDTPERRCVAARGRGRGFIERAGDRHDECTERIELVRRVSLLEGVWARGVYRNSSTPRPLCSSIPYVSM
jgi:hypothetical protein